MKKILLIALTVTGFTLLSAEAKSQTSEVCKMSKSKKACYHTRYAENFKVCKNDGGYQICGEAATYANSTRGSRSMKMNMQADRDMSYTQQNGSYMQQNTSDEYTSSARRTPDPMIAPQSQSYPAPTAYFGAISENAYEGYYPQKGQIKVSYSDNVAEESRAPYEGLPSPQDDGPQKDAARNINANNPNVDLAPITGRPE